MVEPDVLIIGGGSRAMLVLERLGQMAQARAPERLTVCIADPGDLGPGLHRLDQPDYIRFNTESSCPTMFGARAFLGEPATEGLSFAKWLEGCAGASRDAYQPRAVVGAYLAFAAQSIIERLPANLALTHVREAIVAISQSSGGAVATARSGVQVAPRAIVLAIGHAFGSSLEEDLGPGAKPPIVDVFGEQGGLDAIEADTVVAIRGMGLTAIDVIAKLTLGRGGAFITESNGLLRYKQSGREPRPVLYSRSGAPFRARPMGAGAPSEELVFLTHARATALSQTARALSFRGDVYPIVLAELVRRLRRDPAFRNLVDECPQGAAHDELKHWFVETDVEMRLAPILRPHIQADDVEGATEMARCFIQADAIAARCGPGTTLKRALDVLLEARVFVKSLVDFGRCQFADAEWVYGEFSALVNRNVVGPDVERQFELMALIDAGVLRIAPGGAKLSHRDGRLALDLQSGPRLAVDHGVAGERTTSLGGAQSELVASLLENDLAIAVCDRAGRAMGLGVDHDLRLERRAGREAPPMWAIGPVCEGSSYYNNYIPCIQEDAKFPFLEADRIARSLYATVRSA